MEITDTMQITSHRDATYGALLQTASREKKQARPPLALSRIALSYDRGHTV